MKKNRKSGRENTKMAVKKPKKVGVKNDFCPWKKLELGAKIAFTPTFEFHAQKNKHSNIAMFYIKDIASESLTEIFGASRPPSCTQK